MNKRYQAKGFYEKTKRRRFAPVLIAKDEIEVARLLKDSGYTEPFEIEEIFEPAGIEQIEWANKLGISVPERASREDLYALCYKTHNKDSDASSDLIEYATSRGLYFSKYRSEKDLNSLVWHSFTVEERIAVYAFKVYRWLTDDEEVYLHKHKHKEVFHEFAKEQFRNITFVKSFERNSGDFEYFGYTNFSDGYTVLGSSTNSIAYKICSDFLHAKFGIQKTKTKTLEIEETNISPYYRKQIKYPIHDSVTRNEYGSGCFSVVLLFLVFFLLIVLFV